MADRSDPRATGVTTVSTPTSSVANATAGVASAAAGAPSNTSGGACCGGGKVVHHIALFKFPATTTEEETERLMVQLRDLASSVPNLMTMSAGKNFCARSQGYTHGLVATFPNAAAVEGYMVHPAHQEVAKLIRNATGGEPVLAVDFQSEVAGQCGSKCGTAGGKCGKCGSGSCQCGSASSGGAGKCGTGKCGTSSCGTGGSCGACRSGGGQDCGSGCCCKSGCCRRSKQKKFGVALAALLVTAGVAFFAGQRYAPTKVEVRDIMPPALL